MIIRRDLFNIIGGFNSNLRMKEDTEFYCSQELGIKYCDLKIYWQAFEEIFILVAT